MKRTVLALALVFLLQGCGGGEADSARTSGQSPATPDPGQMELWKMNLMLADRASNSEVQASGPSRWSGAFASDGSVIRSGVGEIRGREAVHDAFMEKIYSNALADLRWSPERAEVSATGDLGYTVGQYLTVGVDSVGVQTPVRGMYVRIWALEPDSTWKVKLEIRNPVAEPDLSLDPNRSQAP